MGQRSTLSCQRRELTTKQDRLNIILAAAMLQILVSLSLAARQLGAHRRGVVGAARAGTARECWRNQPSLAFHIIMWLRESKESLGLFVQSLPHDVMLQLDAGSSKTHQGRRIVQLKAFCNPVH